MIKQGKVTCELKEHIALITIDNPPMNPLDVDVMDNLRNSFELLLLEKDVRVVILTGKGKSFIAGADIKELTKWTPEASVILNGKGQQLVNFIEQFPTPVIAAINGYALGGGLEIALGCDIRIASSKAKLGLPETKLGIIPGYSGTVRLPRTINMGAAKKMIYTGIHITATEAYNIGLVDEVTEPDLLLERSIELANQISLNAPKAVQAAKLLLNKGRGISVEESLRNELIAAKGCYSTKDSQRGIDAFINKTLPVFEND